MPGCALVFMLAMPEEFALAVVTAPEGLIKTSWIGSAGLISATTAIASVPAGNVKLCCDCWPPLTELFWDVVVPGPIAEEPVDVEFSRQNLSI